MTRFKFGQKLEVGLGDKLEGLFGDQWRPVEVTKIFLYHDSEGCERVSVTARRSDTAVGNHCATYRDDETGYLRAPKVEPKFKPDEIVEVLDNTTWKPARIVRHYQTAEHGEEYDVCIPPIGTWRWKASLIRPAQIGSLAADLATAQQEVAKLTKEREVKRRDLKNGDCFEYADSNAVVHGNPRAFVVHDDPKSVPRLPPGWAISWEHTASMNDDVRLLEHFSIRPVPTVRAAVARGTDDEIPVGVREAFYAALLWHERRPPGSGRLTLHQSHAALREWWETSPYGKAVATPTMVSYKRDPAQMTSIEPIGNGGPVGSQWGESPLKRTYYDLKKAAIVPDTSGYRYRCRCTSCPPREPVAARIAPTCYTCGQTMPVVA